MAKAGQRKCLLCGLFFLPLGDNSPVPLRADCDCGNQDIIDECQRRGLRYPLRLQKPVNDRRMIARLFKLRVDTRQPCEPGLAGYRGRASPEPLEQRTPRGGAAPTHQPGCKARPRPQDPAAWGIEITLSTLAAAATAPQWAHHRHHAGSTAPTATACQRGARPAASRHARHTHNSVMAKTLYVCRDCGASHPKWLGRCAQCGAWNTLDETLAEPAGQPATAGAQRNSRFQALAASQPVATLSEIDAAEVLRTPTGQEELDRVLGGGIVEGAVVLIGGDPGIGKSTLLLQALDALSVQMKVLYVTGEESGAQVALRARRLGLAGKAVRVAAEIQLEKILAIIDAEAPQFVVIDSIQTVYSDQLGSAPGSVAQVRECASQLTRVAKTRGCSVVLVGHVTKEGALAGPRVLEHIVDTVLYFEGDTHSSFRLVRAIKNRFGAVNEIGVFAMTEKGLKGVSNPSAIFLSTHSEPVPGTCVLVTLEGTRPLLVEIQALVDSGGPSPRRLSVGLDRDRLAMLLAVLHRHAGVSCMDQDVFVNAVGGVRIGEPAADLAVLLAIQGSLRGRALPRGFIAFGEVGLAGEVRPAPRGQERLKEAAKLGFSVAVVPKANAPKRPIEGLTVHAVERIEEAIEAVRSLQ